jgi:hypothetical protein
MVRSCLKLFFSLATLVFIGRFFPAEDRVVSPATFCTPCRPTDQCCHDNTTYQITVCGKGPPACACWISPPTTPGCGGIPWSCDGSQFDQCTKEY